MTVYYIGGSPCSGKSTVAEALAARYGLTYFKADDCLDDLIAEGVAAGLPVCERLRRMTAEETWIFSADRLLKSDRSLCTDGQDLRKPELTDDFTELVFAVAAPRRL